MNTLIFAGGILCGALATFVFVFITIAITVSSANKKKKDKPIISEDMLLKLYDRYMEKMNDDGK